VTAEVFTLHRSGGRCVLAWVKLEDRWCYLKVMLYLPISDLPPTLGGATALVKRT
jgi:hypothetical protein